MRLGADTPGVSAPNLMISESYGSLPLALLGNLTLKQGAYLGLTITAVPTKRPDCA